ncbi:MAG: phytochelatin synthase family protein [Rhabdochlamydiaceae bacterium]|nr:phytochelatin synthase family protein [Candidatus Amphrikana amoebophyrae]
MSFIGKLKKYFVAIAIAATPLIGYATEKTQSQPSYSELRALDHNYITQEEEYYSAVATGVISTNTLSDDSVPIDQASFFNNEVRKSIQPAIVHARGMELDELEVAMQGQGLKTDIFYATTMTKEKLASIAQTVTNDPNQVMIANYDQSYTGLNTGLTYGIIAGYDAKNKRVLMMNVSPTQKKLQWIKLENLVKGMQVLNKDKCPHGFIIVSKPLLDDE